MGDSYSFRANKAGLVDLVRRRWEGQDRPEHGTIYTCTIPEAKGMLEDMATAIAEAKKIGEANAKARIPQLRQAKYTADAALAQALAEHYKYGRMPDDIADIPGDEL